VSNLLNFLIELKFIDDYSTSKLWFDKGAFGIKSASAKALISLILEGKRMNPTANLPSSIIF
jgi:hypothetical protein